MRDIVNKQTYDKSLTHFVGQQVDEKTIYCFNAHWITIIGKIFRIIITTIFFFAIIYIVFLLYKNKIIDPTSSRWLFVIILFTYGYYFHSRMAHIFDTIMKLYIVTNMRIIMIDKSIFFKDNKDIIDLKKIQDIASFKTGFWSNTLGYGHIEITLSSTHSKKSLLYVPQPHHIVEIIDRAKRTYIVKHEETKHPGENTDPETPQEYIPPPPHTS